MTLAICTYYFLTFLPFFGLVRTRTSSHEAPWEIFRFTDGLSHKFIKLHLSSFIRGAFGIVYLVIRPLLCHIKFADHKRDTMIIQNLEIEENHQSLVNAS